MTFLDRAWSSRRDVRRCGYGYWWCFVEGLSCKTFDAAADGYARAEGVTAICIRRLEDAVRDGNPIRAVIRGSATDSDGKRGDGGSVAMPSGLAHEALIRAAYQDAGGLDPGETAYVECHGTGTPTGYPIETGAVGRVFGGRGGGIYIGLGSVKPNVGHSEMRRAVMALEHKVIPPNIKLEKPNPGIKFEEHGLKVPLAPMPFPKDKAERATQRVPRETGGTTKTHRHLLHLGPEAKASALPDLLHRAVLQDEDFTPSAANARVPLSPAPLVMVFSGQGAQWPQMGRELLNDPEFLAGLTEMNSVLHSLEVGHRPAWHLVDELAKPGETSQIDKAELGQPLCTALQVALVKRYHALGVIPDRVVGHSSGEIAAAFAAGFISMASFPWLHFHGFISMASFPWLHFHGFISMAEAIVIAYYRGYLTQKVKDGQKLNGGMAAVALGRDEVTKYLAGLQGKVVVACENSPTSSTISGNRAAVEEVVEAIKRDCSDTLARMLKVEMAYHSYHMKLVSAEYENLLRSKLSKLSGYLRTVDLHQRPKRILFFSSVTGQKISNYDFGKPLGPGYWSQNLSSSVLFSTAMSKLSSTSFDIKSNPLTILEIGPHSTLAEPIRQILQTMSDPSKPGPGYTYISAQIRHTNSRHAFLCSVGQLYQIGTPLKLSGLFQPYRILSPKAVSNLSPYPFDHTTIRAQDWFLSNLNRNNKHLVPAPVRKHPKHFLLGSRISSSPDLEPQWRNVIRLRDQPWLADHMIQQDVIFPFVGYVTMAGEAVRQIMDSPFAAQGYKLRHVVAYSAMLLPRDSSNPGDGQDNENGSNPAAGVRVLTRLKCHQLNNWEVSPEWFDFTIMSYRLDGASSASWTLRCHGQVAVVLPINRRVKWKSERLPRHVDTARMYDAMNKIGLVYGSTFRALTAVSTARYLSMFTKIFAPNALRNVTLLTTKWDRDSRDNGMLEKERRERSFKERPWKELIKQGASTRRIGLAGGEEGYVSVGAASLGA
ncbi:hypothetical protein V8F06_014474 [Rhypophila decipiens]